MLPGEPSRAVQSVAERNGLRLFLRLCRRRASQWQPNLFRNTAAIYPFQHRLGQSLCPISGIGVRHIRTIPDMAYDSYPVLFTDFYCNLRGITISSNQLRGIVCVCFTAIVDWFVCGSSFDDGLMAATRPRLLRRCRGEATCEMTQECCVWIRTRQRDANACHTFNDACCDLDQLKPDRRKLRTRQRRAPGHRLSRAMHEPVSGGMDDQTELVGFVDRGMMCDRKRAGSCAT